MNWLVLVFFASVLALAYAAWNFFSVNMLDEGSPLLQDMASRIRMCAVTFLHYEFRIFVIGGLAGAAVLFLVVGCYVASALLFGAIMSSLAALVGMRIASYANVRVSIIARTTK